MLSFGGLSSVGASPTEMCKVGRGRKNFGVFRKASVNIGVLFGSLTISPVAILELCLHLGQWMVERPQATIF